MRMRFLAATALSVFMVPCAAVRASDRALEPTPDVGSGPNHRSGAPYRAKLSPPLAEGTVLVVKGHVRASDTSEPLSAVVLDAFQADAHGQYDMSGYDYRARVLTDENGYFEFETIHPESYGPPPHIHFVIRLAGYRTLSTELLFKGDLEKRGERDHPEALVTDLVTKQAGGRSYQEGRFEVVLTPDR